MAAYTRLVERAPEDLDARFQRARLALSAAQPGLAVEDLSHVLAARPDWEGARYRRAQALYRLGRHREALADLDIEIATTPGDQALYELRAIVGEALGEREHAGADKEKASSLQPKNAFVLNNLAWTAATRPIARRDPERAVALARRVVELAPRSQYPLTLGVALYRAGQYAEAISCLDRSGAARNGDIDPSELFFLAMAHDQLGHHQKARGYYDEAVRWLTAKNSLADTSSNGLAEFRAEAESTLASSADDLPDQVFANPR
jgi:tetratricopeptide (TPR) repeat protein